MRTQIFRYLLLGIGISGMLVSAFFDFIRPGKLEFGISQISGFVVSSIVALAGLYRSTFPKARAWAGLLFLVYLGGILFMGLKPSTYKYDVARGYLMAGNLPRVDFIINIIGFIPFGYLTVLFLFLEKRRRHPGGGLSVLVLVMATATGTIISFLLETVQYYIPGRTSSLYDLIANAGGTCIGVLYFWLEKKITGR
jgi:glycopeptide antibiotics resistance protein